MRISFTGEHSYEINIQSSYGKSLWEKCFEAGKEFNITPYGTETMHLLRAEKGFIISGQDTDGTMTPVDLQMDWIISKQKYVDLQKKNNPIESLIEDIENNNIPKNFSGSLMGDSVMLKQNIGNLVPFIRCFTPFRATWFKLHREAMFPVFCRFEVNATRIDYNRQIFITN